MLYGNRTLGVLYPDFIGIRNPFKEFHGNNHIDDGFQYNARVYASAG